MADVLAEIEGVAREGESELAAVANGEALEQFRIKYLGTKGRVKGLMTRLGQVSREQKPVVGQRVNAVKDQLTAAFEARKQALASGGATDRDAIDITEPGRKPELGNRHILMKVVDELTE